VPSMLDHVAGHAGRPRIPLTVDNLRRVSDGLHSTRRSSASAYWP
jgi:hypothetical protein